MSSIEFDAKKTKDECVQWIRDWFEENGKDCVAIIGISGGKDSMCLLHLLLKSKDELGITVKAINVEHGIRGEKSLSDSDFVAKECAILGIPLYFQRVDSLGFSSENGLSVEEAARTILSAE